mgnify:CR=1 FL=1
MKETSVINNPYTVNCAGIYIYKSMRKNAALIDTVCFNHLITNENHDRKIDDNSIYEQYVYVISDLIYTVVHETNNNINNNTINVKTKKNSKKLSVKCKSGIQVSSPKCTIKQIANNTIKK